MLHEKKRASSKYKQKRRREIPMDRTKEGSVSDDEPERRLKKVHVSAMSHAPSCRPWDRGDLMRRLATFKAMTCFAKPKVISPVNCARRGWVNVELDIISCEACGARLMFSTPTSWTAQQGEEVPK